MKTKTKTEAELNELEKYYKLSNGLSSCIEMSDVVDLLDPEEYADVLRYIYRELTSKLNIAGRTFEDTSIPDGEDFSEICMSLSSVTHSMNCSTFESLGDDEIYFGACEDEFLKVCSRVDRFVSLTAADILMKYYDKNKK
jgi:hypothetical protein